MKTPNIQLSPFQWQVAIGTSLGDSSLSKPHNGVNYHLSCYHARKQAPWLRLKHRWLAPASRPIQWCSYLDKRDGKTRHGGRFHTVSIPDFTRLAGWLYADGTKLVTADLLAHLTHPVALACLIGDDGHWDKAGIQIATKQFTSADNRALARCLTQTFALDVRVHETGGYPHLRMPAASVSRIRELCAEFLPACLTYKLGPRDYKTRLCGKVEHHCEQCGRAFLAYASAKQRFCSRQCSARGRPYGWATRRPLVTCPRCGATYRRYSSHQRCCPKCKQE